MICFNLEPGFSSAWYWPGGDVGYAGYDAINVRSQHGLDCLDWLGPSVRGLGKTFTINQSGPGAQQSVAAGLSSLSSQFTGHGTSSVNIVNIMWILTCTGSEKWMKWEEKTFEEQWSVTKFTRLARLESWKRDLIECIIVNCQPNDTVWLRRKWTITKWWPKTWIIWSKEPSCHSGTTFG